MSGGIKDGGAAIVWQPISTAPRDGTWFVIWTHGAPEVGKYNPSYWPDYVPEPGMDGLYRKQQREIYEWQGFNNFSAATHWAPITPPEDASDE